MPQKPVTLGLSLLAFTAWILFGFVFPVGVGVVHAFLAVSAILFVRWWGLTR
jgi:hypothetical protein